MKVLKNSDLNKISGASYDPTYMCTYSLIQYQNSRFIMLMHAYNGNTAENTPRFNSDKESNDMYLSWINQYCSTEMKAEYVEK